MFPDTIVHQARKKKKSSSVCKFYHIVLSQRRCHNTNLPTKCKIEKEEIFRVSTGHSRDPCRAGHYRQWLSMRETCWIAVKYGWMRKIPEVYIYDCTKPWHQLRMLCLVVAEGVLANFQCADASCTGALSILLWDPKGSVKGPQNIGRNKLVLPVWQRNRGNFSGVMGVWKH